jgi:hypothetical protein
MRASDGNGRCAQALAIMGERAFRRGFNAWLGDLRRSGSLAGRAVDPDLATLCVCYSCPSFGALQSGVPLLFRSGVMPWPSAIR